MKKKSRTIILAIILCMMVSMCMTACDKTKDKAKEPASQTEEGAKDKEGEKGEDPGAGEEVTLNDEGKTLTVYSWNEEFKGMLDNYYLKDNPLPDGVELNYVINPSDGGVYQQKLDQALESEEEIDIFLLEADYAAKYVESSYTAPVTELGITEDVLSAQYPYTHGIVTDSNGALKGLSWQATPGLFMYRRSLAEKYLGTQEPDEVQKMVSDFDKFLDTARKVVKESGGKTKMLSGVDDIFRVYLNNRKQGWVVDGKLNIDPNMLEYMEFAKVLEEENLTAGTGQWLEDWNANINSDNVFSYFFSTWGIQWVMTGNSVAEGEEQKPGNGTYGDWAATLGPQPYFWGGTWIAMSPTCDNQSLVKDIMEYFTIEKDSMKNYCLESKDYVNSKTAIQEIIDDGFEFDFLGGQNHYALFQEQADDIDISTLTGYDQLINDAFAEQVTAYSKGEKDKDSAIADFKAAVKDLYADIEVE